MTTPKSEEDGVLREWAPLSRLLGQIPLTVRKGLFFEDVKFTCVDAVSECIVIGTNVGLIFWYDRNTHSVQKLSPEKSGFSITSVRIVSTVDYMVAAGDTNGVVSIFKIPKPLPEWLLNEVPVVPETTIERFNVGCLHTSHITALEWSLNGQKLFSGDSSGKVVFTEIDFFLNLTKAREILHKSHQIVQLSYNQHLSILVVSSLLRCVICSKNQNEWKVIQMGQKERNCLSELGGVFFLESGQNEPVVFSCRPGLRLWQADLQGSVQKTILFKDALRNCDAEAVLLSGSRSSSPSTPELGLLFPWTGGLVVSISRKDLLLLDPIQVDVRARLPHSALTAACATSSEVFLVLADRDLVRLSFSPDSHDCSLGGVGNVATAESVSPLLGFNLKPITGTIPEYSFGPSSPKTVSTPCEVMYGQDTVRLPPVIPVQEGVPEVRMTTSQYHTFSTIGQQQFDEIIYRKKANKNKKWRRSYEVHRSRGSLDQKMWSSISGSESMPDPSLQCPFVEMAVEVPPEILTDLTNLDNIIQDIQDDLILSQGMPSSPPAQENKNPADYLTNGPKEEENKLDYSSTKDEETAQDPSNSVDIHSLNTVAESHKNYDNHLVCENVEKSEITSPDSEIKCQASLELQVERNSLVLNDRITEELINNNLPESDLSILRSLSLDVEEERGPDDELKFSDKEASSGEPESVGEPSKEVRSGSGSVDIDSLVGNMEDSVSTMHDSITTIKDSEFKEISLEPTAPTPRGPSPVPVMSEELPCSSPVPSTRVSECEELTDYFVIKREFSEESKRRIHPWINSLKDMGEGWKELVCPDHCVFLGGNDESIVMCTPRLTSWGLSGAQWHQLDLTAEMVALAPSSSLVCKTHSGVAHFAKNLEGNAWSLLGREVEHVSVDDDGIWYIISGELFHLSKKSKTADCIPIPYPLAKIYSQNNVLLGISREGVIVKREGAGIWSEICGSDRPATLLALGPGTLVWLVDTSSSLYVTDSLAEPNPHWWQVVVQGYHLFEISAVLSTDDYLLIADAHRPSIYVNRSIVKGHRWETNKIDFKCNQLTAECMFEEKGAVWLLGQGNQLFSCTPSTGIYKAVALNCNVVCMSGTSETLWLLSQDGSVYIRRDISESQPLGTRWTKLNLEQIMDRKMQFVHISCSWDVVWGCDIRGNVLMTVGPPHSITDSDTFSPAWVTVEGSPLHNNTFTKVYVGAHSHMVWALDSAGNVYVREGIFNDYLLGTGWVPLDGIKASELCISGESVWALSKEGVYKRVGVTQSNYIGDDWILIPGLFEHISVSVSGQLWGIDSSTNRLVCHHDKVFPINTDSYIENDWTFV